MFVHVWERLAVANLVIISPCGSLPSSLDGREDHPNKQTNKQIQKLSDLHVPVFYINVCTVWERLAVASLVFISLCGRLPTSLDGREDHPNNKQRNKQTSNYKLYLWPTCFLISSAHADVQRLRSGPVSGTHLAGLPKQCHLALTAPVGYTEKTNQLLKKWSHHEVTSSFGIPSRVDHICLYDHITIIL